MLSQRSWKSIVQWVIICAIVIVAFVVLDFDMDHSSFFAMYVNSRLQNKSISIDRPTRCTIVLIERNGRLGNRLFMFASTIGLALTHSCHVIISREIIEELNQSFDLDLRYMIVKPQGDLLQSRQKIYNHCSFLPDVISVNSTHWIELTGFWQVHKSFIEHSHEIRRQLQFKKSILDRVNTFIENHVRNRVSTSVGIHIRRGDYLKSRNVSSEQYIFNAMSYFTKRYRSILFVVISDDRSYCKNLFVERKDVVYTPSVFDAIDDLAAFTRCDHAIITVGTFGWWGAFLLHHTTGIILTDSKPDRTPLDTNCERGAYFPPSFLFLNKTEGGSKNWA